MVPTKEQRGRGTQRNERERKGGGEGGAAGSHKAGDALTSYCVDGSHCVAVAGV